MNTEDNLIQKRNWAIKGLIFIAILVLAVVLFYPEKEVHNKDLVIVDGFAQGSVYHMVFKTDKTLDLKSAIDSLVGVVDASMSLYNEQSLISRINRGETDLMDKLIIDCINTAAEINIESGGLYDITIKPLTAAYGFTGGKPTQNPNVDSILQFVGFDKIKIKNNRLWRSSSSVQIDLNSIAQGATVDYIARYIDSIGIKDYVIELGGEIFSRGVKSKDVKWSVGIDRPTEGNYTPGADLAIKLRLENQGLATSGNYRKFYIDDAGRKIGHTVNPITGESIITNLLSATVVAATATEADAYGTAFMVMGLEESKKFLSAHNELSAVLIYTDDSGDFKLYITPNMESMIIK